jgi:cytochrome c oxidase assembly protein Cox11
MLKGLVNAIADKNIAVDQQDILLFLAETRRRADVISISSPNGRSDLLSSAPFWQKVLCFCCKSSTLYVEEL